MHAIKINLERSLVWISLVALCILLGNCKPKASQSKGVDQTSSINDNLEISPIGEITSEDLIGAVADQSLLSNLEKVPPKTQFLMTNAENQHVDLLIFVEDHAKIPEFLKGELKNKTTQDEQQIYYIQIKVLLNDLSLEDSKETQLLLKGTAMKMHIRPILDEFKFDSKKLGYGVSDLFHIFRLRKSKGQNLEMRALPESKVAAEAPNNQVDTTSLVEAKLKKRATVLTSEGKELRTLRPENLTLVQKGLPKELQAAIVPFNELKITQNRFHDVMFEADELFDAVTAKAQELNADPELLNQLARLKFQAKKIAELGEMEEMKRIEIIEPKSLEDIKILNEFNQNVLEPYLLELSKFSILFKKLEKINQNDEKFWPILKDFTNGKKGADMVSFESLVAYPFQRLTKLQLLYKEITGKLRKMPGEEGSQIDSRRLGNHVTRLNDMVYLWEEINHFIPQVSKSSNLPSKEKNKILHSMNTHLSILESNPIQVVEYTAFNNQFKKYMRGITKESEILRARAILRRTKGLDDSTPLFGIADVAAFPEIKNRTIAEMRNISNILDKQLKKLKKKEVKIKGTKNKPYKEEIEYLSVQRLNNNIALERALAQQYRKAPSYWEGVESTASNPKLMFLKEYLEFRSSRREAGEATDFETIESLRETYDLPSIQNKSESYTSIQRNKKDIEFLNKEIEDLEIQKNSATESSTLIEKEIQYLKGLVIRTTKN